MNKRLFKLEVIGFVFVSVVGTLAHFMFEWSGFSETAALLCPVNESPWEHLKLIFFPYVLWGIIELFFLENKKPVMPSKLAGVLTGMLTILAFYYTYTGIIGKDISFLDILSFFIGVFAAFAVDYIMIKSGKFSSVFSNVVSVTVLIALAAVFFLFTVAPPFLPLFKDPQSQSYGL